MIANKSLCKVCQSLTFLMRHFIETVLKTFSIFVPIMFVFFVDTLSILVITSLHSVIEVSAILFKYSLFLQIHPPGFQL